MRIIKPPHDKVRVSDIAAFFGTDTKHVERVLNGDMSANDANAIAIHAIRVGYVVKISILYLWISSLLRRETQLGFLVFSFSRFLVFSY